VVFNLSTIYAKYKRIYIYILLLIQIIIQFLLMYVILKIKFMPLILLLTEKKYPTQTSEETAVYLDSVHTLIILNQFELILA